MTNTYEPSQQRSETNQSEDPINPKLKEELDGEPLENPEDEFSELQENPEDELHGDLHQLNILSDELKNTKEPSQVSLSTLLQNIIDSINISHSEITNLRQYRVRMREHYATGMSKEDIKSLNITKSQLWSKFIDPITRKHLDVRKR